MNESKGTEHTFALSTDLVLIKPIGSRMEPYTTADTVAEYAKVKRPYPQTRKRLGRVRGFAI